MSHTNSSERKISLFGVFWIVLLNQDNFNLSEAKFDLVLQGQILHDLLRVLLECVFVIQESSHVLFGLKKKQDYNPVCNSVCSLAWIFSKNSFSCLDFFQSTGKCCQNFPCCREVLQEFSMQGPWSFF